MWGLLAGRVFRILLVTWSQPTPMATPGVADVGPAIQYLREGFLLQLANGSSLVRDSLHVLLVGPFFGQAWVGYYGWGLQLSRIASQAFVGISARVSVPVFAQAESFAVAWDHCRRQVQLLTILTGPLLGVALLVVPSVNAQLFHGRWTSALGLLPLLFLRMLPGLATTPVGSLLMVWRGGASYAWASLAWTALDVVGAGVATIALGPTGLAWSYAVMAWMGLMLLVLRLRTDGGASVLIRELAATLLVRSSLVVAGVLVLLVAAGLLARGGLTSVSYLILAGCALPILLASYASEREVRNQVRRTW